MATRGSVRLSGRFRPGTQVRLVKVRDESVLRAEGGEEVGTATVDKDGVVEFSSGVEAGARYFACGYTDGSYLEVRLRGRDNADDSVNEQAPVGNDRVRLSDGSFLDEPPAQHQGVPPFEVGPHLGQHQVPKGVVQRTDTPRGSAHPVDPSEQAPYRRVEDVPDGTVQAQDLETGRATEIVQSVQRQEDAKGILQRTDTPHGQAFPIPSGGALQAQLDKESAAGKESRGEPGRVASEPLTAPKKVRGAGEASGGTQVLEGEVTSGHDAMGQPLYPDAAAVAGVTPASKPAEARGSKLETADKPETVQAADPLERLDDPPQDLEASETEDATTGAGQKAPTGETDITKAKRRSPAKRAAKKSPAKKSAKQSSSKSTTAKKEK